MPRRNLLVILTQGLRSDALSDAEAWPRVTPNLDQICQRSRRLIATSACPADNGGLISLLTCLHARQHGCLDPGEHVVATGWPRWLIAQGYHVTAVGCVGALAPHLEDQVFVENVGKLDSDRCTYLARMDRRGHLKAVKLQRRQRLRHGPFEPDHLSLEADDDIDGFIANEATARMKKMPLDKPWALLVVFSGPGNDLPPPIPFDQVADPASLESAFVPADLTQVDILAELDYPRVMLQRLNATMISRLRANYLGRVSLIDYAIGRLLHQVAGREDHDRTWSIVTSSRGQLLGEHGLVGQRSFLAGAIEAPVVITPPKPVKPSPAIPATFGISTVDVAATVGVLGGCDLPKAVAGRSLLPLVVDPNGSEFHVGTSAAAISEFGHRLMFHSDNYKVVFDTHQRRPVGLYDVVQDADEYVNLIDDPVASNVLDALRWRLADGLLPLRALRVR